MKKRFCLMLCILTGICAFLGCHGNDAGLKRVELHEVTRSVFYAPQYVAAGLGYFEEEGLSVNITTSGGSDKAMTALISGDADICLAGPETAVYVYNEGKNDAPVIVGQLTKRDGSFLLSRQEENEFRWENLKGATIIGGRRGGMPFMTLCYVLEHHGLTVGEDVEVLDSIQFNMMGAAFEGGTGDYVTLFEPTATEFASNGKGHIAANVGLASGEVPYTAYMVSPRKLREDSDIIERFLRAIYRAQKWIETAPDEEVAQAMAAFFPDTSLESLMIVAKSYRETDSWKKELEMYEQDYHRLLSIMEHAGELTSPPPFRLLVDNTLAKKIQTEN